MWLATRRKAAAGRPWLLSLAVAVALLLASAEVEHDRDPLASGSVTAAESAGDAQAAPEPESVLTAAALPPPSQPSHGPMPVPNADPAQLALDPRFGVADGFRVPRVMRDIGAGWERVVLPWPEIQPTGPDDFSGLGTVLLPEQLEPEVAHGVRMAGLLQFTPNWAQADPDAGGRSVPANLDLPYDDPDNYWGRFVYETARYYRGRIDEWILWNEPEFHPGDPGGGGSYSWEGTEEQFDRLMKVGYLAAKAANPEAVVSFPGTSYWVEQNQGKSQFYERFLRRVAADPDAASASFFHDAVSLNLYRAPDDLVRIHALFKDIQHRYGVDKPLWLPELNAMPSDDPMAPCADRFAASPIETTLDQQAAYAVQAFSLAAAVGYERVGFFQMYDGGACSQEALWGVVRDDLTPRPVATALRTTVHSLAGFTSARLVPLPRATARWPAWPAVPSAYIPNWRVYQVAFDLPQGRRVSVLWNADGAPVRVRLPRRGDRAVLRTWLGDDQAAESDGSSWLVPLERATAHFGGDPDGYAFIGGPPLLLIEDGVPPDAPVTPPRPG